MGTRRSDLLDLSVKYPPSRERFTCAGEESRGRDVLPSCVIYSIWLSLLSSTELGALICN
jgi:hypothetical protein